MYNESPMTQVIAAIIEKDGKILIARRKKGSHLAHKWEFPGGKIEPGETHEQCLKRELLEELGIKVNVEEFICSSKYAYENISIELCIYKVSFVSGEFSINSHEEIRWISPGKLSEYDLPEANIPVTKIIIKYLEKFAG